MGSGESDEALVRRLADTGEERALATLYDRYGGLIYASGLKYLGDRLLAEDLVQDVFLAVWRGAGGFDPSRASFSTWVYRIARNRATDLDRRRRSRPSTGGEEPLDGISVGDHAGDLAAAFDVLAALSRLSAMHREVLVLAYFEGLTQREAALRVGVPLGTIKSRTAAALKALREVMEPAGEGSRDG
jgi:RNA polymerase sigma-70 factor (ECF subfamily)